MSLPTLGKTWHYNVNNTITTSGTALTDCSTLLWSIKQALIGLPVAWTVVGSCNGSAAGMDGVDRWTAASSLTWTNASTGARSWIVLKNTAVATNFQLVIECRSSSTLGVSMNAAVSMSAGFTGGTTTARPTATDEVILLNLAPWLHLPVGSSATFGSVYHVTQSSDGTLNRVVICVGGNSPGFWMFGQAANPASSWTDPVIATMRGAGSAASALTHAAYNDAATLKAYAGGGVMNLYVTAEGFISGTVCENLNAAPNDFDGTWPLLPLGLASTDTGKRGRHGRIQDLWFGPSATIVEGTTYPNDTTRQFVQFGHMVFPWNGTVPVITA